MTREVSAAGVGEIVTLVGPAGCGKSWWVHGLGHYGNHQVLSLDRFRMVLTDDIANQKINPVAVELRRVVLEHRARQGLPTVLDATNVVLDHRRPLLAIANRYQRPTIAVVFHTPLTVCLQRQRTPDRTESRPGQPDGRDVPDKVVRGMWESAAQTWDRMHLEADCVVHVAPDGKRWVRVGDVPRPKTVSIAWLEKTPSVPGPDRLPWPTPYAKASR